MAYRTTVGRSLVSSGVATLRLKLLPYDSLWGLALLAVGIAVLYVRR